MIFTLELKQFIRIKSTLKSWILGNEMILSIHLSRKTNKDIRNTFFSKYFFYFGAHFEQKLVYKKIENPIF